MCSSAGNAVLGERWRGPLRRRSESFFRSAPWLMLLSVRSASIASVFVMSLIWLLVGSIHAQVPGATIACGRRRGERFGQANLWRETHNIRSISDPWPPLWYRVHCESTPRFS
jgi:hypothetical protein